MARYLTGVYWFKPEEIKVRDELGREEGALSVERLLLSRAIVGVAGNLLKILTLNGDTRLATE